MTVALEIARGHRRVVLCEAGPESFSPKSQDLYDAATVGDTYFPLKSCRARQLGGTSALWAGWCRPLDAIDFERPAADGGQWPLRRVDLEPFLADAAAILDVKAPHDGRPIPGTEFQDAPYAFSPPVRFAQKFRADLESSPTLQVVLHAAFVGAKFAGDGLSVAHFRDESGATLDVSATHFVLACGGIENSRLLLWLNANAGRPIANPDLVGRHFMEHPYYTIGECLVETRVIEEANRIQAMAPTAAFLRSKDVGNCSIRLDRRREADRTRSLVRELACVAPEISKRIASLVDRQLMCGVPVTAMWEQLPHRDNRVVLTGSRDRLGVPIPQLNWVKRHAEANTVRSVATGWAEMMAVKSFGRAKLADWVRQSGVPPDGLQHDSCHHMGGTRMGTAAHNGVLDADSRVFGVRNLFVTGSSVFVTGGYANPTMTIVQLALRLAKHLLG